MKHLRCNNPACKTIHEAEDGAPCPKCAAGCHEIAQIHYVVVSADGPIFTGSGPRMIACNPNRTAWPKHASGERLAVTCVKCRTSVIFREDEEAHADQHVDALVQRIIATHGPALQAAIGGGG